MLNSTMVRSAFAAFAITVTLIASVTSGRADDREDCGKLNGDQAIAACTRAIQSGRWKGTDLAVIYNNRGFEHRNKNDHDNAIRDYDEAIRLYPRYALAFNNRANSYYRKRDYDRAILDHNEAIKLNPKFAAAYYGRGVSYFNRREYDRAIRDYDEAIRNDAKQVVIFLDRGTAYYAKGDLDRAIANYDEAIRLDPKYVAAYNNRGNVFRDKGDHDRAIRDYDESIRLSPGDAVAYNNRGNAHRDKNDHDRAIKDYDEALRLDPAYTGALTARGLSREAKGDREGARGDFNAALALPQKYSNAQWAHDTARARLAALGPVTTTPTMATVSASPNSAPPQRPANQGPTIATGRRVALVIGNGNYANIRKLPNAPNDAQDFRAALASVGFEVDIGVDLTLTEMQRKVTEFARKAQGADVALAFFAGHGVQMPDLLGSGQAVNYLLPVDADIKDASDLGFMIAARDIVARLQGANGARILILDACRDNPIPLRLAQSTARSGATARGLGREPKTSGTFVAYSTQPDDTADDGTSRNSPFMTSLLRHITKPGLDIRLLFADVRQDVFVATQGKQRPESFDSLDGRFSFRAGP